MLIFMILSGLLVGSFLNVCIHRIPRGESVVFYSSYCPFCKHDLDAFDLVPVFSYLFNGGKCRHCKTFISPRYVLVELITSVIFVITFINLGCSTFLVKYLLFYSLLIIIFFIDLEHKIIPNKLVIFLLIWGVCWQLFLPERSWWESIGGALLGGGFLLLIAVISGGGMGGGDIKLMFAAGLYLGTALTGLALFLSFLGGAGVGLILLTFGFKKRKDYIPFGPFLTLGIFIAVLWGNCILEIYMRWAWLF